MSDRNLPTDLVATLRARCAGCRPTDKVHCLTCDAADELERLEHERSEWAGIAAVRNRNIAMIADERDRLKARVYCLKELLSAILVTGRLEGHPIKIEAEEESRFAPDVPDTTTTTEKTK